MLQGDIRQNLENLFRRDFRKVTDPLERNLIELHDLGVTIEYLIRCLELLRDTPCSTNMVEQGHGSGAVLMRGHQLYEERT